MRVKVFMIDASNFTAADTVDFMQRQVPHTQFEFTQQSSTDGVEMPPRERVLICVAYHLLAPAAATALHQMLAQQPAAKLVIIRDAAELPSLGSLLDALAVAPPAPRPSVPVRRPAPAAGLPRLSEREAEILSLLQEGLQNKLIARRLGLSVSTVKTHVANIFRKVGAGTRLDAICKVAALSRPYSADTVLPFRRPMAAEMFSAQAL